MKDSGGGARWDFAAAVVAETPYDGVLPYGKKRLYIKRCDEDIYVSQFHFFFWSNYC